MTKTESVETQRSIEPIELADEGTPGFRLSLCLVCRSTVGRHGPTIGSSLFVGAATFENVFGYDRSLEPGGAVQGAQDLERIGRQRHLIDIATEVVKRLSGLDVAN
jgi:hypothetical protein